MHEYKLFSQEQMDQRGWRQPDLVRASGLSGANGSRILNDERPRLGQMPDESTLVALARGLPRDGSYRPGSCTSGYVDVGAGLGADLSNVSIGALLEEVRSRVVHANQNPSSPSSTSQADGALGVVELPRP